MWTAKRRGAAITRRSLVGCLFAGVGALACPALAGDPLDPDLIRKYAQSLVVPPAMPKTARNGSSPRRTRSVDRRQTSSTAKRSRNAPVARTSVNRSEVTPPDWRMTFETAPFSAQSVAAVSTIAYPSAGRRVTPRAYPGLGSTL